MAQIAPFAGFPKQALTFLRALGKNNKTEWFKAHREEYDAYVLDPSRAFVIALGERLRKIAPDIQADPKVNGSLFRLNRDTRFSKDKSPYKTNVGIFLWEGPGKRMECPGYYFHLEPPRLMLGAGMYMFPKDVMEPYRQAVVDPKLGPKLAAAVAKIGKARVGKTGCGMENAMYKRVPKGYDPDHPNSELLKRKGLSAGFDGPIPAALHSAKLLDFCMARFAKLAPLHDWLVAMQARR